MDGGSKLILINREKDGITYVTINRRPKSLNALTTATMADLARAFRSLDADPLVHVIVLSGSGCSFCSGLDLIASVDQALKMDEELDLMAEMDRCRKPIIGAIHGFALAMWFELALACDVVVAAKGTKFIDTHAKIGILYSWGLSQRLSRVIGPNRAREVSLTELGRTSKEMGFG